MKKSFFEEDKVYSEGISKYFGEEPVITFGKIQNEYNIKIYGCDFNFLASSKELKNIEGSDDIAGMVKIEEDFIELIYNNSPIIDTKEQRFILANLVGYCETSKKMAIKKSKIKSLSFMLKCDEPFENMNQEEFSELVNNILARQILMPKKSITRYYEAFKNIYNIENTIMILSELFQVPQREVLIRLKELGLNFSYQKQDLRRKRILNN